MPISVKQQAALGITGTAVVATGGTLIYKNINSKTGEQETESAIISQPETQQDQNSVQLITLDQLAINTESWNIEQPSKVVSGKPEALKVVISVQKDDLDDALYGVTSGSWKCEIVASPSSATTVSDDYKTALRKNLDSYFLGYSSATSTQELKIERPNREAFVKKCLENKAETLQVNVSLDTLTTDLKKLFGEIPLLKLEQDAVSDSNWTITSSSSKSGKTTTFTIKVEDSSKSWICSVVSSATADSVPFDGIKTDLKEKFNVEAENNNQAISATSVEKNNKEAFVNSCARNRKGSVSADISKVESELNLSLNGHSGIYKFEESAWKEVFEGTWINSN